MSIVRGVFYCPWRYTDYHELADYLSDKYVNTVSLQRVGNGWNGHFYYPSDIAPRAFNDGYDAVDDALHAFDRHAIDLRAHLVVGNDAYVASQHPDWLAVRRDAVVARPAGAFQEPGYHHLCCAQPAYQDRLVDVAREIVGRYPLAGIDLDYVRFPWTPAGDFCYCDHCRSAFQREHALDPLTVERDTPEWEAWLGWRADQVTTLVRRIRQAMDEARPQGPRASLMLYIAPWWSETSERQEVAKIRERFGQDLVALAPYSDAFAPMLYHHYTQDPSFVTAQSVNWVGALTRWIAEAGKIPVWSTTQVFDISPLEARVAVEVAFNGGASGSLLFPYGSIGSTCGDETWLEIKKAYRRLAEVEARD